MIGRRLDALMRLMSKKFRANLILFLLAYLTVSSIFGFVSTNFLGFVEGNFVYPPIPELQRVSIEVDGNVNPTNAPIQRIGETYVFMDNIHNHTVEVKRSNIVIDGAGHILNGNGGARGIILSGVSNVTIKNVTIKLFNIAIEISCSPRVNIIENLLLTNAKGIAIKASDEVIINRNRIESSYLPQDFSQLLEVYCVSVNFSLKVLISNNELYSKTQYGIKLEDSSNIEILNNVFHSCGIFPSNSFNNKVSDNMIDDSPIIYLEDAFNEVIDNAGQVILLNCTGIHVYNVISQIKEIGIQLMNTNNSKVLNSTADIVLKNSHGNIVNRNNGIIHLEGCSNCQVTENNGERIIIKESTNINICDNTLRSLYGGGTALLCIGNNNTIKGNLVVGDFSVGIEIIGTYNKLIDNFVNGTYAGIVLKGNQNELLGNVLISAATGIDVGGSCFNIICRNNITRHSLWGIIIDSGSNNTVCENNIAHNNIGVALGSTISRANNNLFYCNNFIKNNRNVGKNWDEYGANIWDNSKKGNYWSDYNGTDVNGDGIGDTPYVIDWENQDRYPLMSPFLEEEPIENSSTSNLDLTDTSETSTSSNLTFPMEYAYTIVGIVILTGTAVFITFKLSSRKRTDLRS